MYILQTINQGLKWSNSRRRVAKPYKAPSADYFGCRHCYNLSYESRNESRFGRIGQLGYLLKAEKQYEEFYNKIKRWTYKGKPTKKVRKLRVLDTLKGSCLARQKPNLLIGYPFFAPINLLAIKCCNIEINFLFCPLCFRVAEIAVFVVEGKLCDCASFRVVGYH